MDLRGAEREMDKVRTLSEAMPISQHVRAAVFCRPPAARTSPPEPGDVVWYRHEPFGTLTEATVEQVDTSNPRDTYVWAHVIDPIGKGPVRGPGGQYVMEMVDDPWPDVYLRTRWGRIVTREARIEGSPGWLPRSAAGGER